MGSRRSATGASWAISRQRCYLWWGWGYPAKCPVTTSGRRRCPVLLEPAEEGPGQPGLADQEVEFVVARESRARPIAAPEEHCPGIEDPELRMHQLVAGLALEAHLRSRRLQKP